MNDSVCFHLLKFVSGCEKLDRLDHDEISRGLQQMFINDGFHACTQPGFASDQQLCQSHSVAQMT